MLRDELAEQHERLVPAALICSVLANINRDPDRRSEPYTPADFLPGAKSEEDEMREFVEAVQRGDRFELDPEDSEAFKRKMQETFRNVASKGTAPADVIRTRGSEPPRIDPVRTNAIAGEGPGRGLR